MSGKLLKTITFSYDDGVTQDQRLVDMLSRYRARNFPESLDATQCAEWLAFCRGKLSGEVPGAPVTVEVFMQEVQALVGGQDEAQRALLQQWQLYVRELANKLNIDLAT